MRTGIKDGVDICMYGTMYVCAVQYIKTSHIPDIPNKRSIEKVGRRDRVEWSRYLRIGQDDRQRVIIQFSKLGYKSKEQQFNQFNPYSINSLGTYWYRHKLW